MVVLHYPWQALLISCCSALNDCYQVELLGRHLKERRTSSIWMGSAVIGDEDAAGGGGFLPVHAADCRTKFAGFGVDSAHLAPVLRARDVQLPGLLHAPMPDPELGICPTNSLACSHVCFIK